MLSRLSRHSYQCSPSRPVEHSLLTQPASCISRSSRTVFGSVNKQRPLSTPLRAVDGGVIDKPQTGVKEGIKSSNQTNSKKPPIYNVMLHNDNYNKREYVVKVLLKVVDGLGVDDAVNVMQLAHVNGVALVVACGQDKAEQYVESLRLNGLVSTLEPGC